VRVDGCVISKVRFWSRCRNWYELAVLIVQWNVDKTRRQPAITCMSKSRTPAVIDSTKLSPQIKQSYLPICGTRGCRLDRWHAPQQAVHPRDSCCQCDARSRRTLPLADVHYRLYNCCMWSLRGKYTCIRSEPHHPVAVAATRRIFNVHTPRTHLLHRCSGSRQASGM